MNFELTHVSARVHDCQTRKALVNKTTSELLYNHVHNYFDILLTRNELL